MSSVRSNDGTAIGFERTGSGPPLIIVDGALCWRESGPSEKLAAELADRFTVITYDRRGRGESGDTAPYSVEREVEDLEALIGEAGGPAHVLGISSGGVLAMEAVGAGAAIDTLTVYEAPFIVDDSRPPAPAGYVPDLNRYLASGDRGAAVKRFMRLVGMPGATRRPYAALPGLEEVEGGRPHAALRRGLHGRHPVRQAARPRALGRGRRPHARPVGWQEPRVDGQRDAEPRRLLPNARREVLEGQTHMVKAKVLAPTLKRSIPSMVA